MRICHSLWSKPLLNLHAEPKKNIAATCWLYALSVAYARSMEISGLILHTDLKGMQILGFLPYDGICLSLNDLAFPPGFWAAGKILAQSHEPIGSIHIDGDVFLKNPDLLNKLQFDDFDLLVQNQESFNQLYAHHLEVFQRLIPDFQEEFCAESAVSPLNCGLIGFNNDELKTEYVDEYLRLVGICVQNNDFMNYMATNPTFTPDLILEQYLLGKILSQKESRLKTLLPVSDFHSEAVRIGYTHLVGKSKYELLETVKLRLFELDPVLYKLTEKQVDKFSK